MRVGTGWDKPGTCFNIHFMTFPGPGLPENGALATRFLLLEAFYLEGIRAAEWLRTQSTLFKSKAPRRRHDGAGKG